MLPQEQRDRYQRDGYLVIPDFKTPGEIAGLRARAEAIVDAFDTMDSRAVFTMRDQENASDAWFAVLDLIDLSEIIENSTDKMVRIVLEANQKMMLKMDTERQ